MRMQSKHLALLALLALLAFLACSGAGGYHPPPGSAEIEGFVTQWNAGATPSSLLVEVKPGEEQGGRKIYFRVTDETQLLRWNDDAGGYGTIDPVDVVEGDRVRVWSTGPVAESYPEQATAHTIVLLEE